MTNTDKTYISHLHFCIQTTMISTRIQIYNILYLDSPHFPGFWPAIVLFTVALTEAHLGAVQIQSCANLLVPFFVFFFTPTPPSPSISLIQSPLISVYLCPKRWRCEIFKHTLLFGDNALQQMGHHCTDPNVCKSPYKAAQDVFNITQVPQALF